MGLLVFLTERKKSITIFVRKSILEVGIMTTGTLTMTQKGQITLTKAIRDALGVSYNDKVDFVTDGNVVEFRKHVEEENPFANLAEGELDAFNLEFGIADTGSVGEENAWIK
jgi:bifunctional DNA-binding transcriptional regulator/antitoxin component of YhaV-PrlF toxin-antitoxin module